MLVLAEGMKEQIRETGYCYTLVTSGAEAANVLIALSGSGVELLAFSLFPSGEGASQLDLIPEDMEALSSAAQELGLGLSSPKTGFLIRGEDRPLVMADILRRLGEAHLDITSAQAISAGAGRFGALLWVKASDSGAASRVLDSSESDNFASVRAVDESSEESFPASDAPSWTPSRIA